MNRTLSGLLVVVTVASASTALADDWRHGRPHVRRAVPVQPSYGPRPVHPPHGRALAQGHYQLQTQQVWVPGEVQQVWEPGHCRVNRRGFQRCTQGFYRTVQGEGHYETRQEWVWVPYHRPRYGVATPSGFQVQFSL